ncbi:MAG: deaminase [Leptonema illini]|uniref:Deaminase n=1 Tax=Leptonema illini TaxID=183 RepID=A0A833GYX6_9LEPT|nr:MAG: deaminase [Leptonema illini]PKL33525.1 MAG: deaminase [Spirochaetae bacterium HGW-Spirochaetae-10]
MRKITLYMQSSVDGIVSDPDRWANISDEILEDALQMYENIGTVVFGGRSYPSMAQYWTGAEQTSTSELERAFAKKINEIDKIVISRSPVKTTWKNSRNVQVADEDALFAAVQKLRSSKGGPISVEAGVKLWQLFLQNRLYDELWMLVHPAIAGSGQRLFDVEDGARLQFLASRSYENGVMGLRYALDRTGFI